MTLGQFIAEWTGKKADWNGTYLGECVSLVKHWEAEIGETVIYGNAIDEFKPQDGYNLIPNSPTTTPNPGDIVIWGDTVGQYGHIAIFVSGDSNAFQSFDQNWPVGSAPHIQAHNYNGVLGWLRPTVLETNQGGSVDKEELTKFLWSHIFNAFMHTYYGRPLVDNPRETYKADCDYWYSFNPDYGCGSWIANQINETEFKDKWYSKSRVEALRKTYEIAAGDAEKVAEENCETRIAQMQIPVKIDIKDFTTAEMIVEVWKRNIGKIIGFFTSQKG